MIHMDIVFFNNFFFHSQISIEMGEKMNPFDGQTLYKRRVLFRDIQTDCLKIISCIALCFKCTYIHWGLM